MEIERTNGRNKEWERERKRTNGKDYERKKESEQERARANGKD